MGIIIVAHGLLSSLNVLAGFGTQWTFSIYHLIFTIIHYIAKSSKWEYSLILKESEKTRSALH